MTHMNKNQYMSWYLRNVRNVLNTRYAKHLFSLLLESGFRFSKMERKVQRFAIPPAAAQAQHPTPHQRGRWLQPMKLLRHVISTRSPKSA